ncbi:hypothetical protein [Bacillus sp. FJAT-50079]|uniref:hypothetical protein n=1 Tax=Bacillus sp. FJAT-50079 TaxID=2833577 RepID=UPI001BC8D285|nr:hypothetical protein [Bacillus sp. FJAT-50079]MBS4206496.1 hypothetical protein [Bacillus sp. FJAT-50079]
MARGFNSLFLLGVAGIVGAKYFSNQENRDKAIDMYESMKGKVRNIWGDDQQSVHEQMMEKAGNPDPYDVEDSKMVDEGAMYSVDYYNKEAQQPHH